jgi:hypothetical protein
MDGGPTGWERVSSFHHLEEGVEGKVFAFTPSNADIVLRPLSPYRGLLLYHGRYG